MQSIRSISATPNYATALLAVPRRRAPSPTEGDGAVASVIRLQAFPYSAQLLLAAAIYAGLDALSDALAPGVQETVVGFGFHDGFALALLLLAGARYWPAIVLGGLLTNYLDPDIPWALTPLWIGGNVLEALAGRYLVQRMAGHAIRVDRWRDMGALIVFGALLSTAVSAFFNAANAYLLGLRAGTGLLILGLNDWLGGIVGVLVVTLFIIALVQPDARTRGAAYYAEAGALLLLTAALAGTVFSPVYATLVPSSLRYAFLLVPLIVWGAIRFEARGSATLCLLIALTALVEGPRGSATAAGLSNEYFIVMVALYIAVAAGTGLVVAASSAERRQVGAMRHAAGVLQQIFEALPLGVRVADAEGRITSANPMAEELGLYDAPASRVPGWIGPERRPLQPGDWPLARVFESHQAVLNERIDVARPDGTHISLLCSAVPLRDDAGAMIGAVGVKQDVSVLLEAEARALKLARAREVISRCNHILIHATDEQAMLDEMCRVVVDIGGYALALVGVAQADPERSVRFVSFAAAGDWAGPEALKVSWAVNARGAGATGTALRSGKSCVIQDVRGDSRAVSWSRFHAELGIRAIAAFPFQLPSGQMAALSVNSTTPGAFGKEEIDVFEEFAADTGFGIRALHTRTALAQSEEMLRELTANMPEGYWIREVASGAIVYVSPMWERLSGVALPVGAHYEEMLKPIHADDRERIARAVAQTPLGGLDLECRIVHVDGTGRWLRVRTFPIRDKNGAVYRVGGVAEDVTERKNSERVLQENQQLFNELTSNIPEMIWVWDAAKGDYIYLSPAIEQVFGRKLPLGKTAIKEFYAALHPDDVAAVSAGTKAHPRGGYDGEFRVVRPDGSVRWVHGLTFAIRNDAQEVYRVAGVYRDITERKTAEERLLQLAHYDHLTDLPNRAFFNDALARALDQAKENDSIVSVLFLDLDRFKEINDTLGHAAGDDLLRQVAARLLACVRARDVVGRLGGDEFALILPLLKAPENAGRVAEKILQAFAAPFFINDRELFVTPSIGVTLYPADATTPGELLRNADTAMYRAKDEGRNDYSYYTTQMNARADEKLELETSLRRALERKEFLLYYQPKLDLASGAVCGVEALLRWQRPGAGLVSPAHFIPLLEQTGLIVPVGEWIFHEACRQINTWMLEGVAPVPIAVNLSGRQFHQKSLAAMIGAITREHGVEPRLLEFEITESSVMANAEETVHILEALRLTGTSIAVDDFGTGYSSLAYLKRFPIDAVKIDQSFVRDIVSDADDAAIALAVIGMAHALELKVIAEGVETEAQLQFLREHACDQIQGYYFARPMDSAAIAAFLRERQRAI